MDSGVDTSKWKPRRLRGTPANSFIKYLSFGVLTIGIIVGCIFE